jgi:hypothetical protein
MNEKGNVTKLVFLVCNASAPRILSIEICRDHLMCFVDQFLDGIGRIAADIYTHTKKADY